MYVLLVIFLVIISVFISNYFISIKESKVSSELANNNEKIENKNFNRNLVDENPEESNKKFRDFLLLAKTLSPEIELDFLLSYYFEDKKLNEENRAVIERKLFIFATNNSYFFVKKLVLVILEDEGLDKIDKIDFFKTSIIEAGFPSVIGLSKVYIEYIENEEIRDKLIFILEQINRISILKFIEFVEDDILDETLDIFSKDKKYLLASLENK